VTELQFDTSEDFAIAMDARDPLAGFRERFHFPRSQSGEPCIYLCGHSLGLQPKTAQEYVDQELSAWAQLGVEGHFRGPHPWMPYHRLLTEKTASLVGAKSHEVVMMNSLTVNLHLMMVSFYRPTSQRYKILIEQGSFPSDEYAVKSQLRFHGFEPATSLLELSPRKGESCIREEDIESFLDEHGRSIALILLGGVNYATGQAFDLARVTELGHRHGCVVAFDLAHTVGNLCLQLHDWGPDFAVWCSYKYLNGGPGCIAGCFVHERHSQAADLPRFAGWWGHQENIRFQMGPDFQPMLGAEGWQLSNPPILELAALRASMDIFCEAGMERLRPKSELLTAYLEFLLDQHASTKFSVITPRDPNRRGAQLSLRIPNKGRPLCDALAGSGVIGDWREPDTYRIAPVPLYNSFHDVYKFVQRFLVALE
jgi:kynureninase